MAKSRTAPRASQYQTPMKSGGKMQGHRTVGNTKAASSYHKLAKSPTGRNATT